MTGADFLTAELARIAWLEGSSEGLSGAKAVAFTVRNRVRAGWFGGSWAEILSHHRDWSATQEPLPVTVPDPREPGFRALLQDVTNIFTGQTEDNITIAQDPISSSMRLGGVAVAPNPCLYFGRIDRIENPWFLEHISRNTAQHRIIAQVGMLHFWN